MRAFLIDSENVNFDNFIRSQKFKKKDNFFIVGNATLKFSLMALEFLHKRRVKFYNFNEVSKDYADKIILTLLGFLLAQKKLEKCFIVSNDNIFNKLGFTEEFFGKKIRIIKINNEQAPRLDVKPDYHIQLFEKNAEFIRDLRAQSKNLGEFHRALQKHFKIHGTLIYKYLKETHKDEFFKTRREPAQLTTQHPKLLTHKSSGVNLGENADKNGNADEQENSNFTGFFTRFFKKGE
ncbi:hypothetical protein [Campylobacter troglodytis]|uniref:hypothetical protein n=1 Tax=Campylobacter troglodytis TaxID=654363 RepID=UPI0011582128|nr:hypothetical protein [Campylobacter troglodytis]TQR61538.1 hypothetical protein DMC01_00780 [Campylobacter troglodytis]